MSKERGPGYEGRWDRVEISGGTGQEREGRGFRERESRRFLAGREQGKGAPSVMGKGARCAWECATERDGKGRSWCLGMGCRA
jgi:hypothetical protein